MNWYDAVIHAMSTAGTGGFSNQNLSIGSYGSPAIEVVITIFMLLFSINFAVYFLMLCGKWKNIMKSDELRFFLGMVVLSTGAIAWNLHNIYGSAWDSIRHAAFQVASIVSTTGFSSADFDQWPEFSRMLMVLLMFIGACAGSTGGGIKCARILVLFKTIRREICSIIHPRSVTVVKLDGETVSENTLRTIQSFFVTYMFFIFAAALIVGLDNFSFGTTLTSVITCVSNVGPGLEKVGPMGNFSEFSILSKLTLSFCMIVGRLEVFPMLVLFSRNAWKHS
jgi:trk system potassium uptake protein TrkH